MTSRMMRRSAIDPWKLFPSVDVHHVVESSSSDTLLLYSYRGYQYARYDDLDLLRVGSLKTETMLWQPHAM